MAERDDKEKSYALPARFYRDPLESILAAEAETCAGCAHASTVLGRQFCLKRKPFGRRCKLYQEVR